MREPTPAFVKQAYYRLAAGRKAIGPAASILGEERVDAVADAGQRGDDEEGLGAADERQQRRAEDAAEQHERAREGDAVEQLAREELRARPEPLFLAQEIDRAHEVGRHDVGDRQ